MTRELRRVVFTEALQLMLALAAFVLAVLFLSACGASLDDKYRAKIGMCVEEANTLAESKACRQLVDAQFNVYDGGVR